VTTPDDDELSWENLEDENSGGIFQHDDVPDFLGSKTFQETVYFPLDGSAPEGVYQFYVYNNHEDPDPARPYTLSVYEGDKKVFTKRGRLNNGDTSDPLEYEYVPTD
jgi:hypothetical protein